MFAAAIKTFLLRCDRLTTAAAGPYRKAPYAGPNGWCTEPSSTGEDIAVLRQRLRSGVDAGAGEEPRPTERRRLQQDIVARAEAQLSAIVQRRGGVGDPHRAESRHLAHRREHGADPGPGRGQHARHPQGIPFGTPMARAPRRPRFRRRGVTVGMLLALDGDADGHDGTILRRAGTEAGSEPW